MNAAHRVTKARIAVSNREEFLSSLVHRLIVRETDDVPTTATDGVHLFFNPAFVESISDEELRGAVEHETLHCALGYFLRMGGRNPELWNQAHDYAINLLCKFKLPKDALLDERYRGMSAEQVYEVLKRENPPRGGKACGGLLQPKDGAGKPLSPAEQQQIAEGWELAVIQAANTARKAGKLPADLDHLVSELRNPEINWRDVLWRFAKERIRSDYSLIPPNRRYLYRGLFLHSLADEERVGRIVTCFDTSGSIYAYPDLLAQFVGEERAIVQDVRPVSATVIECDAAIKGVTEYEPESFPETLQLHGGGGTDFRPPFEWVEEQGVTPECLIYFTDLEGSFPAEAPPYPVLWVVYGPGNDVAPFGETVRIR